MMGVPQVETPLVPGANRGLGDNLLLLLDIPAGGRVVIVGEELQGWRRVFGESSFLERFATSGPGTVDLALYHASSASTQREMLEHLKALGEMLTPAGRLLFFAPNGYSPTRMKLLFKADSGNEKTGLRCSRGNYWEALAAAGFSGGREFLSMSDVATAEELVDPRSSFLENSRGGDRLWNLSRCCGLLPALASGYLYLEGNRALEQGRMFRALDWVLSSSGGKSPGPARVERIDLRQRGAMILFVVYPQSGRQVIVRIVSGPSARAIVRRNREFLQKLQACAGLPDVVRDLLPRPLGEFSLAGCSVQVETKLPGLPAWKVAGSVLTRKVYPAALDYIWQLQLGSRVPCGYAGEVPARLFTEDLERLNTCPTASLALRRQVAETGSSLRGWLANRSGYLVTAHGDYGYGNILVSPQQGRLTGVIDWDTGRLQELPGLDLLNFEVQRYRAEQGSGVHDAFVAATGPILARGGLDDHGGYAEVLGVAAERLPGLLHACLLRYLCRAANYPEVLAAEQEDYLRTFE